MATPRTLAELRALSDSQLVAMHDGHMENLAASVSLFRDELNRRAQHTLTVYAVTDTGIGLHVAAASLAISGGTAAAGVSILAGLPWLAAAALLASLGAVVVLALRAFRFARHNRAHLRWLKQTGREGRID